MKRPPTPVHRRSTNPFLILFSGIATIYVVGRLWRSSREIFHLRQELSLMQRGLAHRERTAHGMDFGDLSALPGGPSSPAGAEAEPPVLHYSVRQHDGADPPALTGPTTESDLPPVAAGDGSVLGQVLIYVDGIRAAAATANAPHDRAAAIRGLCEGGAGTGSGAVVGFTAQLPPLALGLHRLRAFAVSPDGAHRQELHQSPLPFKESDVVPDQEEALRRKDSIILLRNAQLAALWDELHTAQPWRNALSSRYRAQPFAEPFDAPRANETRLLAVFAINTGVDARARRDTLRRTWVPVGAALGSLEAERGVLIRFVVGRAEAEGDAADAALRAEAEQYGDIIRMDMVDTYSDLALKTRVLFSTLVASYDADFYFKMDDDIAVNVPALADYLAERRHQGNLYLGCMKSGEVLTDPELKWYEPEHWRFGDPAGEGGKINYPRHASGQIYGLSRPLAQFIAANQAVLHRYANEDVGVGAWLLGLEVEYVDERRMCCDTDWKCKAQKSRDTLCLAYFEWGCAGVCNSKRRLESIYKKCMRDIPAAVLRREREESGRLHTGRSSWGFDPIA